MPDLLGPEGYVRTVSVRPAETTNPANTDTWFQDCQTGVANTGTPIGARFLNRLLANLRSLIRKSAVAESNADDHMVTRAVRSHRLNGFSAGGATNAWTITPDPAFAAWTDLIFVPLWIIFPAANTVTNPTLNVNGLGAKTLVLPAARALRLGEIQAGQFALCMYDGTNVQVLTQLGGGREVPYAVDTGAVNAITANFDPPLTTYDETRPFIVKVIATNTSGSVSITVNGLGARNVRRNDGSFLSPGELRAGGLALFIYHASSDTVRLLPFTPSGVQSGSVSGAANTGTANAIAVTLSPAPVGYLDFMPVRFYTGAANTTAVTLNVNGLGAVPLLKTNGQNLTAGDLGPGVWTAVYYAGNFYLDTPLSKTPPGATTVVFSTPGTSNFTVPAGIYRLAIELVGAGGAGGGSGGASSGASGGGAGGFSSKEIDVTPGQVIAVTVGAGGTSPGGNADGNAGGTSSFGAHCSATGGGGGKINGGTGGSSGLGSGGDFNDFGGGGLTAPTGLGGHGGGSFYGSGGVASPSGTSGIGAVRGSGGAGGYANNAGGAGAPGVVRVSY
jgi:hypothetical protein